MTTFLQTTHNWTHRRKIILVSRTDLTSIIIEISWWDLLSIAFKQRQAMLRSILLDPRCPTVSSVAARTSKRTQSVPIIKTDYCDRSQTYVRLLLLLCDLDVVGKVSENFSSSPKHGLARISVWWRSAWSVRMDRAPHDNANKTLSVLGDRSLIPSQGKRLCVVQQVCHRFGAHAAGLSL